MIEIIPGSNEPIYEQIVEQIRLAVATGRLGPGDRLEPVRVLASQLSVNASTVARAYRLLEQQGIIETNRRRGTVVAQTETGSTVLVAREDRLRTLFERPLVEALVEGFTPEEVEAAVGLQLAAWRERRLKAAPVSRQTHDRDRLNRFTGSHDLAMETLWAQARRLHPETVFNVSYVGSVDGLLALLRGDAALAGSHLLDQESGEYNLPILRRLFVGQRLCIVTLAERRQGLIVQRGNPKKVNAFVDLTRPDVKMVNRQRGSGTRTLLDYSLHRCAGSGQKPNGYEEEVSTHSAVAEAVAQGTADVGLGLQAAARAFHLDFVPLTNERYDLVLFAEDRTRSPLTWLIDLVKSPEFRGVVAQLGGYDTTNTGQELYVNL
jgi:molybdate-binding protein/DNA-binding transcriptional regulator YhcF (GntR family)